MPLFWWKRARPHEKTQDRSARAASPKPVSLKHWKAHNQAQVRGSNPIHITTPSTIWAYAFEIRLTRKPFLKAPLSVHVTAEIVKGAVGFFILDKNGAQMSEVVGDADDGASFVIGVSEGEPASLVVRNWSDRGPSEVKMMDIRTVPGWTPPEALPPIPTPSNLLNHPAFDGLEPERAVSPPGICTTGIGQRIRLEFDKSWAPPEDINRERQEHNQLPWVGFLNEEIYEWIALAEAVRAARDVFTVVELGAGYGRWIVAGAQLARRIRPGLPFKLVGVEADTSHFHWMRQHLIDNGINPDDHDLFEAAVGVESGVVDFREVEDASEDYGQHVQYEGGAPDETRPKLRSVRAIGINDLLKRYDTIDLIDMDIQGYERLIVPAGMEEMNKRVRRAYVSIHEPRECGLELKAFFARHGWRNVVSFPTKKESETEFGPIFFLDGCQYWINPGLE